MCITTTKTVSGKLLAIGFAETMQPLSNHFDLVYHIQLTACSHGSSATAGAGLFVPVDLRIFNRGE